MSGREEEEHTAVLMFDRTGCSCGVSGNFHSGSSTHRLPLSRLSQTHKHTLINTITLQPEDNIIRIICFGNIHPKGEKWNGWYGIRHAHWCEITGQIRSHRNTHKCAILYYSAACAKAWISTNADKNLRILVHILHTLPVAMLGKVCPSHRKMTL